MPPHYAPERIGEVFRVDYAARFHDGESWSREQALQPAVADDFRMAAVLVDVQNTFCTPGFELFVAGRSGTGALDDNRRLCEFVYRNLAAITQIVPTMDTHQSLQIFHPIFLVDADGRHPDPYTLVTLEDVDSGRWRVNPGVAQELGLDPEYAQSHLRYYVETLATGSKYALTVWPFHAMRAGIGHALVSSVE
jgi:nicotinamidase-related amidase